MRVGRTPTQVAEIAVSLLGSRRLAAGDQFGRCRGCRLAVLEMSERTEAVRSSGRAHLAEMRSPSCATIQAELVPEDVEPAATLADRGDAPDHPTAARIRHRSRSRRAVTASSGDHGRTGPLAELLAAAQSRRSTTIAHELGDLRRTGCCIDARAAGRATSRCSSGSSRRETVPATGGRSGDDRRPVRSRASRRSGRSSASSPLCPACARSAVRGYEGTDRAIIDVRARRSPTAVVFGAWPTDLVRTRGAPSLDIVDVEGLRAAAEQAFTARSRPA